MPTFISTPSGNIDADRVQGALPDRKFRSAWKLDVSRNVIEVDMVVARDLFRDKVRAAASQETRGRVLEDFLDAVLDDDQPALAQLKTRRNGARLLPSRQEVEDATTPEALAALWEEDKLGSNPFTS